jgi:hypothetical protein
MSTSPPLANHGITRQNNLLTFVLLITLKVIVVFLFDVRSQVGWLSELVAAHRALKTAKKIVFMSSFVLFR